MYLEEIWSESHLAVEEAEENSGEKEECLKSSKMMMELVGGLQTEEALAYFDHMEVEKLEELGIWELKMGVSVGWF